MRESRFAETEIVCTVKQAELVTDHPEHDSLIEWAGGSFSAEEFEASDVTFDDPRVRLEAALE